MKSRNQKDWRSAGGTAEIQWAACERCLSITTIDTKSERTLAAITFVCDVAD